MFFCRLTDLHRRSTHALFMRNRCAFISQYTNKWYSHAACILNEERWYSVAIAVDFSKKPTAWRKEFMPSLWGLCTVRRHQGYQHIQWKEQNQLWTNPANKLCLSTAKPGLSHLCHRSSSLSTSKTHQRATSLRWLTCSVITINTGTVAHFELTHIQHSGTIYTHLSSKSAGEKPE